MKSKSFDTIGLSLAFLLIITLKIIYESNIK